MKLYGYLAGAALALAACGGGQDAAPPLLTVSDVTVTSDLSAVGSRDAARYWGNLEADLESAIAQEFLGQTSPEGVALAIDIDELSVANFFQSAAGADDARLTGDVAVLSGPNGEQVAYYTVSASANQAMGMMGVDQPVATIPATDAEFYSAVVEAFARGVASAVRGEAPVAG